MVDFPTLRRRRTVMLETAVAQKVTWSEAAQLCFAKWRYDERYISDHLTIEELVRPVRRFDRG